MATSLISSTDFGKADFVETAPDSGGRIRRAFKQRTVKGFDVWVGANAHERKGRWYPGNSYVLKYTGFSIATTADATKDISRLKDGGEAPPGLELLK